jgi:hypothetical protein
MNIRPRDTAEQHTRRHFESLGRSGTSAISRGNTRSTTKNERSWILDAGNAAEVRNPRYREDDRGGMD